MYTDPDMNIEYLLGQVDRLVSQVQNLEDEINLLKAPKNKQRKYAVPRQHLVRNSYNNSPRRIIPLA